MYGDPGLSLKGIIKGIGKVVKVGAGVAGNLVGSLPGIGGVYKTVSSALPYGSLPWEKKSAIGAVTGGRIQGPMPGFGPTIIPSPAGQVMIDRTRAQFGGRAGGRRKRMNPLNPKAARRAIARIRSLRKLTHSIEAQLPQRTVHSRGKKCR
jgi:hypothetical protein